MNLSVFLYCPTDEIIIPSKAQAEAGYYLEVEPVEVAPRSSRSSALEVLRKAAAREIQQVPTPTKFESKSPSIKAAGARSNNDFEKNALLWHLEDSPNDGYRIERWISPPRQSGFVPDMEQVQILPASLTPEEFFDKFLDLVDAAQKEEITR